MFFFLKINTLEEISSNVWSFKTNMYTLENHTFEENFLQGMMIFLLKKEN